MLGTPPGPEELARRLLSHELEQNDSAAAIAAAAERAHLRLRGGLTVFFGQAGFDSLWSRALSLAEPALIGDAGAREAAQLLRDEGWSAVLNGHTVNETRDVVLNVLTSFITLLFTFIGAELGVRLINQAWADLPLDAPRTSTGEAVA